MEILALAVSKLKLTLSRFKEKSVMIVNGDCSSELK